MFNTIHSQQNQIYNTAPTDFCIALHCREYTNYTLHTSSLSLIAPLLHQARLHLNLTAPSLRNTPLHLRVFYFFPFPYISLVQRVIYHHSIPYHDPWATHTYIYIYYTYIYCNILHLCLHTHMIIALSLRQTLILLWCHSATPNFHHKLYIQCYREKKQANTLGILLIISHIYARYAIVERGSRLSSAIFEVGFGIGRLVWVWISRWGGNLKSDKLRYYPRIGNNFNGNVLWRYYEEGDE